MSEQIVRLIKERLRQDPVFREALIASPVRVLQAYALTEEEKQYFVVPNFRWVSEQRLAGVSYPRSEDALGWLHRLGIRALLSLSEESIPETLLDKYQLHREQLPVADFTAPTLAQAHQAVALIEDFVERNLPVAVHCRAGLGRTGTILACYLVAQDLSTREAIEQVRAGCPGSIETAEQEALIAAYEQVRQHTKRD
jgi:atypical dual specificity phosphatase